MSKTLKNTDIDGASKNIKDVVFWGDADCFKPIGKAHSEEEGWMKSTKAMEIPAVGVVVQVTTQQGSNVAEALTFIPGVRLMEIKDEDKNIIRRRIVSANGSTKFGVRA